MDKKISKIGIILVLALALILSSLGILKLNAPLAKEFDVGFSTNQLTAQAATPVWGGNATYEWYTKDTTAETFEIATASDLKGLSNLVGGTYVGVPGLTDNTAITFSGKTIDLTTDIALNDITKLAEWGTTPPANSWTPIGVVAVLEGGGGILNPFEGTFDGRGHKVSGMYINSTEAQQGFFGIVGNINSTTAVVKNLGVIDSYVKGSMSIGGVAAYNAGSLINCYYSGSISAKQWIGGIAGQVYNGSVIDCYNLSQVNGDQLTGGVVGTGKNSTIINCHNSGAVTGGDGIGGIMGNNPLEGTINNCSNSGKVVGDRNIGGIAGNNYGEVTNCYNTGSFDSNPSDPRASDVGGVVGNNYGAVANCYNAGLINAILGAGGVVGKNNRETSIVINCYNYGKVSGLETIGGVVGTNVGGAVANSYFLTGKLYIAGQLQTEANEKAVFENTAPGTVTNCSVFGTEKKLTTAGQTPPDTLNKALIMFEANADLKATLMAGRDAYNKNPATAIQALKWYVGADGYPSLGEKVNINKTAITTLTYDKTAKDYAVGGTDKGLVFSITYRKHTANLNTPYNQIPIDAGLYDVKITRADDEKYQAFETTISKALVLNQIVAELEWAGPTNMVFDGAEKKLTATVKNLASQGTVKDVCVVTVKLTDSKSNINAGKFTYTAESLDNKNYKLSTEPAKFVSQEFQITLKGVKKPTKGTAQTYSGKTIVGINDVVANVNAKVGYTIAGDYHAFNVKTVGDYSAVFTLDINHCWGVDASVDVAPVTITWNILPLTADLKWTKPDNLVYDKKAKIPTVTVANLKTQGTIKDVCDVTIEATTANSNVNVGAFTFTAKGLGNTNYKLPAIVASESYAITAKPIANIIAEKEFLAGNVGFSLKLKSTNCDGLIGTDDVTITFDTSSAEKGTYVGSVSGKILNWKKIGADSGNYSIEPKDIIAKIVGKSLPEITAMTSANYDKNVHTPTVKVGSLTKDTDFTISWKYSVDGKPFVAVTGEPKFIDAGTYRVTATGVVGGEYDNSTRVADYVINPITITLTWTKPANLVYDKTAKIPSVVAGGLLGGDACEVTIALTAKKDNVNAGTFTFTATGAKNTNYTLPSVVESAGYTITKAVDGNAWTATPNISIVDITEGGTLSPKAPSKYGTAVYTYYAFENGFKGNAIAEPSAAGKYYVTAKVEGTASFDSIAETDAKQFSINPKSSGGGSSGGGSSGGGGSSSEDVFWIVVINAIKTNSEAVIKKECNYGTMPKKVLEALKDTDKTLEITMNGEKLTITSAKAKTLTLEKSSYTIEELKAMLADKPVITPTPTVKPTEPTAPEEAANMTWAWVVSALFILSLIIAVYIVREKKNKQKPN